MKKFVLFAFVVFCSLLARAQSNSITFSFTIPPGSSDTATSAGVYDSTNTLVRTLWGNVSYPPGTYQKTWDGNLQNGSPATSGSTYTIKVLENNVVYTYDGKIGTTEQNWYAPNRWSSFGYTNSMSVAFAGGTGWFATGYTEGFFNLGYFSANTPNTPMVANVNYSANSVGLYGIATDGTWVYLMEDRGDNSSFITALDASSGLPVYFSTGTLLTGATCLPPGSCSPISVNAWYNTTISYIDYEASSPKPTGIAVQRSGNILAVAQGANLINLFDKRAGTSLGTITGIANPTQMAFNSEGLWVVSNGQLYLVSNVGGSNTVSQPLSGFSNVVAVGTNGATNSIFVLDGGTHQQMYEYAVTTHSLMRTYGTLGGYSSCDPTVTNTTLMFDQTYTTGSSTIYPSWVSVQDTDDVWIQDGGNGGRILHISPSNQYVSRILFTKPSYDILVSHTAPTRFFNNLLEYDINYGVPNEPGDPDTALGGDGSWTLAKNWAVCAEGAGGSPANAYTYFVSAEQLSNGNFYAQVRYSSTIALVQLPSSGPMRYITSTFPGVTGQLNWSQLLRTGSLGVIVATGSSPNYTLSFMQAPLTGFDSNSNPQWGSYSTLASAVTNSSNDYLLPNGQGSAFNGAEGTTDGIYPVYEGGNPYNSSSTTNQPHLAGVASSGYTTYAWTAMPEVCLSVPDFHGSFPCGGSYGGLNGKGPTMVEGKNIFVMYNGQYAPYGNQYYHYWEDGLLVGQFGQTYAYPKTLLGFTNFDTAGNITSFATTMYNGDAYLYHADEDYAPAHRWHISNLSSVHEYSGSGLLQPNGGVTLAPLF